jgi:hypothetical protein
MPGTATHSAPDSICWRRIYAESSDLALQRTARDKVLGRRRARVLRSDGRFRARVLTGGCPAAEPGRPAALLDNSGTIGAITHIAMEGV